MNCRLPGKNRKPSSHHSTSELSTKPPPETLGNSSQIAPVLRSPGQPVPPKARRTAGFCAPISGISGSHSLGGGGSSLLRTRLHTDFPVKQGKNRENSRFMPNLALLGPAITLRNNRFFFKFPKQQNRELSGGSGSRRTGPPQLQIGDPHPTLFKKPRISAATRLASPLTEVEQTKFFES